MKYFTLLVIGLFLSGCSEENKRISEAELQSYDLEPQSNSLNELDEVLAGQEKINKEEKNAFIELNQKIAYGKILFGMGKRQYRNVQKGNTIEFGNKQFEVEPFFHEDELYELHVKGKLFIEPNGSLKSVWEEIDILKRLIERKYDSANKTDEHWDSRTLNSGETTVLFDWEIGEKKITLGFSKKGYGFFAVTKINNYSIYDPVIGKVNDWFEEESQRQADNEF